MKIPEHIEASKLTRKQMERLFRRDIKNPKRTMESKKRTLLRLSRTSAK